MAFTLSTHQLYSQFQCIYTLYQPSFNILIVAAGRALGLNILDTPQSIQENQLLLKSISLNTIHHFVKSAEVVVHVAGIEGTEALHIAVISNS
jgi:hypothetical protein